MKKLLVVTIEELQNVPPLLHDVLIGHKLEAAGFNPDAPVDKITSLDNRQILFSQDPDAPAVRVVALERALNRIADFDCVESHTTASCGACPSCIARAALAISPNFSGGSGYFSEKP